MRLRSRYRRVVATVGLIGLGACLLSGPGTSCSSFFGESAFVAIDTCFIFDCQNGILGGTVDPCATVVNENGIVVRGPLFVDCRAREGP